MSLLKLEEVIYFNKISLFYRQGHFNLRNLVFAKVLQLMSDRSGSSFLSTIFHMKETWVNNNNLDGGRLFQSITMKFMAKFHMNSI